MENKNAQTKKREYYISKILVCIAVSFLIMIIIYVAAVNSEESSLCFNLTFSIATGILSVLVMQSVFVYRKVRSENYYIWMAALFSFFGIVICYMGLGVYPFGEKSVMLMDMRYQYSTFFSLMREKLREKLTSFDSLSYSNSLGLGGGLVPLIAYYLCSPYNIIALIFPRAYMSEAIALIEVLKITTAGATFAIFCRGVFKKSDCGTAAVSVAYALSAYFIAYSWHIMWLDCLVLLPLIAYGLYKVVHGESPLLYSISLGLAIITSYYIGYMICVFMVMWFVTIVVTEFTGLKPVDWGKKFLRFAWTSLAGGLLSMWILVPASVSLGLTSGAEDRFSGDITNNFDFFDIFTRTLYGSSPVLFQSSQSGKNLPNIYCSVLAVFMIVVFCLCSRISIRKREGYVGLLFVLAVCFSNNWLDFAFHGFHFPNGMPFRYAFLFTFVMLAMAVQVLDKLDEIDSSCLRKALAIVVAAIVLAEKIGGDNVSYQMIWYSLAFVVIYAVISILVTSGRIKRTCALALILSVVFVEVTTNSLLMIHNIDKGNVGFTMREDFACNYDVNKSAVSAVEEMNSDGNRMELLPRECFNDDAMYDYSGLTVFASTNPKSLTTLMGRLGYSTNGLNRYIYNQYVPLVDSIFNLKYVVSDKNTDMNTQLSYVDSVSDSKGNYRYIYENSYALSKGFAVDSDIAGWETGAQSRYSNPFEIQNRFIECAAVCEPVYQMLPPTLESAQNMTVEFTDSYFEAYTYGDNSSFTAVRKIEKEAQTYIYVDCRAASEITVTAGENSWSSSTYAPYTIDLGRLPVGTEVRVNICVKSNCIGNVFIASADDDALKNAIERLSQHQLSITEQDDGYIKGNISVDEECVLFTSIPFDDSWSVYVDGDKTETVSIGGALLGVYLRPGEHEITMEYHTVGLLPGVLLTLVGILILAFWTIHRKRLDVLELLNEEWII